MISKRNGERMNTVNDKKLVGGMINSIGLSQQDLASIKYIFLYLDKGLKEISFETDDDFCLVLDGLKKIKVQVKINTLTIPFVKGLCNSISLTDQNIIIGSGYDDQFRNVLQYKNRYLNIVGGEFYDDKEKIYSDWEEYCRGIEINADFLLKCDFDIMDGLNQMAIARDAIAQWAESKKVLIDVEKLIDEMKLVVADRRCKCGKLSEKDIKYIVSKHRNSRIERYNKKFEISRIIDDLENIIRENPYFEKDVLLIKHCIENYMFVEARSRIEECLSKHIIERDLISIYLWTLNQLRDFSDTVIQEKEYYMNDKSCCLEFAKAHYCLNEFGDAKKWLDKIDKQVWDENTHLWSAYIYYALEQDMESQNELLKCLEINDSCIDALIMLGCLNRVNNSKKAVEYYEKALAIDTSCAEAYYGLAMISENLCDLESALNYYNDYVKYFVGEVSSEIMAKIAVFSVICNKDNCELIFQKWNRLFRKQNMISNEQNILIPVVGREHTYIFILISREDGFSVFCGDDIIFEYVSGKNEARSSIGTLIPYIDFAMHKFVNQKSINPVRTSDRYAVEEVAVPAIIREYDDFESYNETMSKLLETGKLHLNHVFSDTSKEYMVKDDDIEIEMKVTGTELLGNIIVGNITMLIWIDPIGDGFRAFKKQLSKDCSFNDAAIVMKYNGSYENILTFNKKRIHIVYCD